jgi:hypothetical protein
LLQLDTGRVEALGEQIAALASDQLQVHSGRPGIADAPAPAARIGTPGLQPLLSFAPAPRRRDGENGTNGATAW